MPKSIKEISHQSIVEAAWLLAKNEGIASLTMAKVAKAAGLSRQAVYWHFKSRTTLLLEVGHFHDTQLQGADLLFNGVPGASAVESLVAMMKTWLRELPAAAPLLLALNAEALIDEEAKLALETRMADLSRIMESVHIRRIEAEGFLKDGVDPREISDIILILGSPPMWQQLTQFLGWDHDQYTRYVINQVLELVVKP